MPLAKILKVPWASFVLPLPRRFRSDVSDFADSDVVSSFYLLCRDDSALGMASRTNFLRTRTFKGEGTAGFDAERAEEFSEMKT